MAGIITPRFSTFFMPDFGLIGLWPASTLRGAIVSDASVWNTPLTISGTAVVVPSPHGLALSGASFFAPSAVVTVPPSLTLAAWVNPTSVTGRVDIMTTGPAASPSPLLILNTGGVPLFTKNGQTGVTSPVHVVAGQWAHIAGTYDSATAIWAIYVNGVQTATFVNAQTWTSALSINISDSFTDWSGQIADARAYNRALRAGEIYSLYASDFQPTDIEPMALFSPAGGALSVPIFGAASAFGSGGPAETVSIFI